MMKKKNPNINKGAGALHVIFALLFFLMIGRFLYIQVGGTVAGVDIREFTRNWFQQSQVLEGKRGTIFDATGTPLATQTLSYTLIAILDDSENTPQHVEDKEKTAEKLAKALGMDRAAVLERLNRDLFQVEFGVHGRDLSYSKMMEISNLELPGIIFRPSTTRNYPNGVFASYILGFARKDDDGVITGEMGLERSLNDLLRSEDGRVSFGTDQQGRILPNETKEIQEPINGKDVHLTIDATIQGFIEKALRDAEENYNPAEMTVIVSEAKTGRILGMGTSPSFDPNKRDMTNFTNIAVESAFEPGSTMKIFTWAAAIEAGVYDGNSYFQSGSFYATPGGVPIRDHNRVGWGSITLNEGFYRSSNVAAAKIGMDLLGHERTMEFFNEFGLFDRTGIDLPNEAHGSTAFEWPRDRASTMFGQASTTTAIAQVQAMSAIANNGKMMKPFVVEKIVDPTTNEIVEKTEPKVVGTPISKETAVEMRDLLEGVVTQSMGTGRVYAIEGYDVIGKTGTAQILSESGGFLSGHGNYLFSFLGMAPKDNPEIIMYVSVKKPNLPLDVAENQPPSEIFRYVMGNTLRYRNVERGTVSTEELADKYSVAVEDVVQTEKKLAVQKLESQGLTAIAIGDGEKVVSQLPEADNAVIRGSTVFLLTDGSRTMPNIEGWSINDVMRLAELLEIDVKVEGSGFVVSQSIPDGENVTVGSTLTIVCKTAEAGG